ncbi:hypothetical protein Tco_0300585 [Tanacetum coccineum]
MSIGAEMNHKEPGFELEDSKMGRNGLLAFVRLDFELRGFKAWILFLVSALGTPWDLLDQNLAAIVDLEEMVKVKVSKEVAMQGGSIRKGFVWFWGATAKLWQQGSDVLDL